MQPLVESGVLKGVQHLLERGVRGNLTTLEPQLSPMLWTSIATGKHAYHHGVHGFTEVDPLSGRTVPVSAATRRCKTIWEMLGQHGLKSHVVSWFATQGEQGLNGRMVSNMFNHLKCKPGDAPEDWPAPMPGTYWPADLADTMNRLRISPREVDPDEVIRLLVPNAQEVDQKKDRKLWLLAERLAESYSVHSAATCLMETDPDWDFMAVYYRAIDEISHLFMRFHPPRMEGVPERDFEMYREVVNGAYRVHDLMLRRLIQLAGPDTAIVLVSDHGFHSDHLRPKFTPRVPAGITVWHRRQGVIVAAGPGIKKEETIYGARLLDVTPTVLTWFGLPVGEDMEGRVLAEAFVEPPAVQSIPTWEDSASDGRRHGSLSEADNHSLLEQFEALGYIEKVSDDPDKAAAETNRENRWNLARACMDGGRFEQALPLLEDIHEAAPERADYTQVLAHCQMRLGLLAEADETIGVALESFGQAELARLLKANIAFEKGNGFEALRHLEIIRAKDSGDVQVQLLLARTYLKLRRWAQAGEAARKVLKMDGQNPQAFLVLARQQLHYNDPQQAAASALEAIGSQYGNAEGHFLLGVALFKSGEPRDALKTLINALKLDKSLVPALRFLVRIYRALGEQSAALECEWRAHLMRTQRIRESRERADRLRNEVAVRAAERLEARGKREREQARPAADAPVSGAAEFVLVSGLPRSGTSLMMQILKAGGMELMADGMRTADPDNPEGYWEWEEIKTLAQNPQILEKARGKAVKVVSALLRHLPVKHTYRIIFMRRPVSEVVRSQWAMLARRGGVPKAEEEHLVRTQEMHVTSILAALRESKRVELLEVDYPELVASPEGQLPGIVAFLGPGILPRAAQMTSVIKPALYRQRDRRDLVEVSGPLR